MTRGILHLLLLIMLYQDVVNAITLNCSPNNSCDCQNTVDRIKNEWRIFCSLPERIDLTVSLYHDISSASVHCHDMDTWPLVDIEVFTLTGHEMTVEFDQCPWPESSLSRMIGILENERVETLKISKLRSNIAKFTRRNFEQFPKMAGLSLIDGGVVQFSADALQDLSDLEWIRFTENEISVFPRGIFKGLIQLKELYLDDNSMQSVNSMLFENLSELKLLSLSGNHLKTLEPETFNDLVNLTDLDISNNYLTALPTDIFKPLKRLKVLRMSGNEFSSLPHRLLTGNSCLVTVDFSDNRGNLSTLPEEFFCNLTSLRYVLLSSNNFTDLPEHIFVGGPRVQRLDRSRNESSHLYEEVLQIDLSHNKLNNLPGGFFDGLERPLELYLHRNAFTSISRNLLSNSIDWIVLNFDANHMSEIKSWSFSNFTSLKEVSLKQNELARLPENIFWGDFALEYVDISKNRLTDLPVKLFRDSSNLMGLSLNANNLTNLPEGIFQGLDNLFRLDLQNNAFTTLPDKILAQATSLEFLSFEFNHMTEINIGRLRCIPSLSTVSFSHNLITRIIPTLNSDPELLRCTDIPKLQSLALDHNHIVNFLWDEMDIFKNIQSLDLACNHISSVELSSVDFINRKVSIDITRNNITKIVVKEIPWDSRGFLHIGDNPIDCGCDAYQLLEYFVERSHFNFGNLYSITADHLTCNKPESMVGRPVEDLELETFECKWKDSNKPRICLKDCDCMWRPFDDTLIANCSYRNLTRAPWTFYGFQGIAIELNLTGNFITEMPFFHQNFSRNYKYEKVTKIFLSRNRIRNLIFDDVPQNLAVLHLDNNNLTRFHVAVAEAVRNTTSLQEITLHSNPWNCDRETREAFNISREKLDRKIGDAFGKSCLDFRHNKNRDENPASYITYKMF